MGAGRLARHRALIITVTVHTGFILYQLVLNGSYNFKSVGDETPVMADQCATCGAADVLLFTCGYCDRTFCADHSLPHHSCEGLAHPGERVDEESFEWPVEERTTADGPEETDDGFAASGFRPAGVESGADPPEPRSRGRAPPAVERAPRRPDGETRSAVDRVPRRVQQSVTPAVERAPRRPDGDAVPAVERVPRYPPEDTAAAIERVPRDPPEDTTPAVECVPRRVTGAATAAVRTPPRPVRNTTEPAIRPRPTTLDGQSTPAVERAPPDPDPAPEPDPAPSASGSTAADGGAAEQSVPIRPMDSTRAPGRVDRSDPRTLTEWLDQQTYVSLTVKTAALAAVINCALYLGMTLTMYGLAPA